MPDKTALETAVRAYVERPTMDNLCAWIAAHAEWQRAVSARLNPQFKAATGRDLS